MTIFGENYFFNEGFFDNIKKKKQEKEAVKKKADEAKWWNQEQDHLIELKEKYDKFIKKPWELKDYEEDLLYFAQCMGLTESKFISLYNKYGDQYSISNYIYNDKDASKLKTLGSSVNLNTKVIGVYGNDDYQVIIYNNTIFELYDGINNIRKSSYNKITKNSEQAANFDKSDVQKMIKQNWKKVEVEV